MRERDLTINVEGSPGHRGNVLAHELVEKLNDLLIALAQAERRFHGLAQRRTDYEIVAARKVNPTQMTLHPVPRSANYDPTPALDWTVDQLDRIVTERPVDDRVDASLADALANIARKKRVEDTGRFWITREDWRLDFDEHFRTKSERLVALRSAQERPPTWFVGTSYGSVTGELKQAGDADGEHQIVIVPPIGARRIECTFDEKYREAVRQFLWRNVRVTGMLEYRADSPFPTHVEVERVELLASEEKHRHLLEMRGIFKGRERYTDNLEAFLDDL